MLGVALDCSVVSNFLWSEFMKSSYAKSFHSRIHSTASLTSVDPIDFISALQCNAITSNDSAVLHSRFKGVKVTPFGPLPPLYSNSTHDNPQTRKPRARFRRNFLDLVNLC